jgi:hypothetical protein
MKLKTITIIMSALLASVSFSNAAQFFITNVGNGPGDTLYADKNNTPLAVGFTAIGYFTAPVLQTSIDTISGLQSQLLLGTFTTVTSTSDFTAGGLGDGYVDTSATVVDLGSITGANALLGRTIYLITTNQSSLTNFANGSGDNNQVALVNFGTILDDVPDVQQYTGNPAAPATVVIGSIGTYEETSGGYLGDGTYNTLKLSAIPEPTTALLGAIGAMALLRRRRN